MAKKSSQQPPDVTRTKGLEESQYSHIEYGSTRGNWDRGAATDFAITTVNVPDRLDTQEVRAKAATAPSVSRFHPSDFFRLLRWLVLLAILGGLAWGAMRIAVPVREAISPAGVGGIMSKALGLPVTVRGTELRFSPSPRLVITDIIAQNGVRLPEIAVHFNWRDAIRGLQSAHWVLGEARVAPMRLTGQEALDLLQSVPLASGLPAGVSTVRFESVEFPEIAFLPGRYEAVIRRGIGQRDFNAINLKRMDGSGQFEVEVTPAPASGQAAKFAMFASKWPAVVGPAMTWNEATARGEFGADFLKIDSYSVGERFGNLNGAALLSRDAKGWKLTGNLRGPDIRVEELIRYVSGATPAESPQPATAAPLRGTAKFDLAVAGSGASVTDTLQRAVASGSVSVLGAVLAGVNLGTAATQGDLGGSGSVTRFSDLDLDVVVSAGGVNVRGVSGKAGSLRVSGGLVVDRNLRVNGGLRSEVASPRGIAAAPVRVGGTAGALSFQ